ncbi:hypothetical protein [Paraburkholderia adhaesiva]|uniref:hypothetical protein n=1 Tax=Paraburkholderia adhaesiva TaxID=2883244 RepID=UPI001F338ABC|nr:hypothetical protein [Paraburkholderia adhaesiva]
MDTVNVTEHAEPVFIFRTQEYRLDALKGQLPRAPLIEVSTADLNPPGIGEGPYQVRFSSTAMNGPGEEVTFFKQEGKFTVLLGHLSVHKQLAAGATHVSGRLISSPALKRARIDSPVAAEATHIPHEPAAVETSVGTRARNTEPSRTRQRHWRPNPSQRTATHDRAYSGASRFQKGG